MRCMSHTWVIRYALLNRGLNPRDAAMVDAARN